MLVFVLCAWYLLKHFIAARRQTPYQRGIYEHLFYDLAVAYPNVSNDAFYLLAIINTYHTLALDSERPERGNKACWRLEHLEMASSSVLVSPIKNGEQTSHGS